LGDNKESSTINGGSKVAEIVEQGLLAVITQDHAFDKVVARKVFVGAFDRMRIDIWYNEYIAERIKADKAEDPSFDAYGYSLETFEVEVRSDH